MKEITPEFAQEFATNWVESWNSHDIDRILSHYSDDFVIQTPLAAKILPETHGIVEGKSAVREYWTKGLERTPNLKFEVLQIFAGIAGLTISYHHKARNIYAVEVMLFNEELKVNRAFVHYNIDLGR